MSTVSSEDATMLVARHLLDIMQEPVIDLVSTTNFALHLCSRCRGDPASPARHPRFVVSASVSLSVLALFSYAFDADFTSCGFMCECDMLIFMILKQSRHGRIKYM